MLNVAIAGSGPAAIYAVEALNALAPGCRVDVFERLPSPFGLVRYGVAPDHQSTKAITRKFEEVTKREGVRYFGKITIGQDLHIADLSALYDAVIIATGAPVDRELEIPGGSIPGVIGAAAFVGWYNGHPDFSQMAPDLSAGAVAVVGLGNVALDVARVLAKTGHEMAASDIADYAASTIRAAPIRDIYIVGRRGPTDAKFTPAELREIGKLSGAAPLVDSRDLAEASIENTPVHKRTVIERNLNLMRAFSKEAARSKPIKIHFRFFSKPEQVLGSEIVTGLTIRRTKVTEDRLIDTEITETIPCGLIVSAIGYRSNTIPGLPFDLPSGRFRHENGRIAPGVFTVGWAGRGSSGTIASNKIDAENIAKRIVAEIEPLRPASRGDIEALMASRGLKWITYADWMRIDRRETETAVAPQPRSKLTSINEMINVLHE